MAGDTDELLTPSGRIASAIRQLKAKGVVLESLAEKIGCSHATLSQWQTGSTNIDNVKAGLLSTFCEITGTSMRWILTGQGSRQDAYTSSEVLADVTSKLRAMEKQSPEGFAVVARMIDAASEQPTKPS